MYHENYSSVSFIFLINLPNKPLRVKNYIYIILIKLGEVKMNIRFQEKDEPITFGKKEIVQLILWCVLWLGVVPTILWTYFQ